MSDADVSVHLDRATFETLRRQAEAAGVTVEDLVAQLVTEVRAAEAPTSEVAEGDGG